MHKPRQRKPRFQRIPNPPTVRLTERDFSILTLISNHRFLQSHHLLLLIPGSHQHLIRRLGRLYHAGLIDRPKQQLQITRCFRATFVYCLTEKGRKVLQSQAVPVFASAPRLKSATFVYSLTHDLLVSEIVTTIRAAAAARDIEFLWHHQVLTPSNTNDKKALHQMRWSVSTKSHGKNRRTFVIPDAAFCLRPVGESPIWFFLEFDRGTMPVVRSDPNQTSFIRKIHAYQETRRAGTLWKRHQIPGFRVLVVTESRKRLRSLQKATTDCFQRGESSMFLFTCLNDFRKQPDILSAAWETCSGVVRFPLL